MLFSNVDYDDYVGRIGIGRVERGEVHDGENVVLCHRDGTTKNVRVVKLYQFEGLNASRWKAQSLATSWQFPASQI